MSVAQIFDQTSFDSVKVIALSRNGGLSNAPFNSLNLADYVGDESQAVRANLALIPSSKLH